MVAGKLWPGRAEVNQWGLWESERGAFPLSYPLRPFWRPDTCTWEQSCMRNKRPNYLYPAYLHTGISSPVVSLLCLFLGIHLPASSSLRLREPTLHYMTLPACLFCIFSDTFEFLICFVALSVSRARQRRETKRVPSRRILKQSTSVPAGRTRHMRRVSTTLERDSPLGGISVTQ